MVETELSVSHPMPSGLCEDPSGEVTNLIVRLAKADTAALVELHNLWSPTLLGIAYRMLGDRRAADNLVHDCFIRIWNQSAHYDPHQSPPFVWAFVMLRTCCTERLPARARKNTARASQAPLPAAAPPTENPRVMALDDSRRVRTALDQLTPDERYCLEQAVFLQYSPTSSTDQLEHPMGTVKNRLRNALTKIRNHLSRYEL